MRLAALLSGFVLLSSTSAMAASSETIKSIYIGGSWGHDLDVYNDANFSGQAGVFRVPPTPGWAVGGEIAVLGLGSMGWAYADNDQSHSYGPTHYGTAYAGLGLRRMLDGGDRVRCYLGAEPALHLVRTPGKFSTPDPPVVVRPGFSISSGIYGLAPGYLGIEARAHAVAAAKGEGVGGPLLILSVLVGFNAR